MFRIPLTPDEDGMIGRECPEEECQPRYFKIALCEQSEESDSQATQRDSSENMLFCPYCGYQGDTGEFHTQAQIKWAESLVMRGIHREVGRMFEKAFPPNRSASRNSFISFSIEYKPGPLPSVRHYVEKKLKRIVECDQCGERYAVYGIATFCPLCGGGNLQQHLNRSMKIIETLLDAKSEIEEQHGSETGYHLLGNCLEDCVSLFEGFLRVIYSQALRYSVSSEERQKLIDAEEG